MVKTTKYITPLDSRVGQGSGIVTSHVVTGEGRRNKHYVSTHFNWCSTACIMLYTWHNTRVWRVLELPAETKLYIQ